MNADLSLREQVAQWAKLADVSERLVWIIVYVKRHGIPVLCDLIHTGKLSGNKAYRIAQLPQAEQERIAEDIAAGRKVTLPAASVQHSRYERLVKVWNACTDAERTRLLDEVLDRKPA